MPSLISYFVLTFVASWICFLGAAAISGWSASPSPEIAAVSGAIVLLGVFSPALVALLLTAWAGGRAGTMALLGGIVRAPTAARWYVFAVGYFAAIKLAMVLAHRVVAGDWPPIGQTSWFVVVGAIVVSTPVQAGEEIGWRAYALPRLAERVGLPLASVVLGVIWALWHLPLFFIPGSDSAGQSFPVYLLAVTALSTAMAWLYWRTERSLLLTMLMHAAVNNVAAVVASPPSVTNPFSMDTTLAAWLTAALLWITAPYFLVRMRHARPRP